MLHGALNRGILFEEHAGKKVSSIVHRPAPFGEQDLTASNTVAVSRRDTAHGDGVRALDVRSSPETHDATIDAWASRSQSRGSPSSSAWNWEMNGTWGYPLGRQGQGRNPAVVQAWRALPHSADAAGATNVTWVWCPNVPTSPAPSPSSSPLLPGRCLRGLDRASTSTTRARLRSRPHIDTIYAASSNSSCQADHGRGGRPRPTAEAGRRRSGSQTRLPSFPVDIPRDQAWCWFNWRILEYGSRMTGKSNPRPLRRPRLPRHPQSLFQGRGGFTSLRQSAYPLIFASDSPPRGCSRA